MNRRDGAGALRPDAGDDALAGRQPGPDGPLKVPSSRRSALQAGGVAGYARDGHAPWTALEEVIGTLEGGRP